MSNKSMLIPQYMNKFNCIGSECEDNCCYGWNVSIDEDTYKKYRKIKNADFKLVLDKNVTRNRSNPSYENYAKIRNDKNGVCPFQGEDNLCTIHRELGENYLSRTCTSYPRMYNMVGGVKEKGLTLSCPEAARVALLNPNKMEFDEVQDNEEINYLIKQELRENEIKNLNTVKKYFWELRIFCITLVQNRDYSLEDRLIILGIFLRNIQNCIDNNELDSIPSVIGEFAQVIEDRSLDDELKDLPVNLMVQMKLMKGLSDERFSSGFSKNNQKYLDFIKDFLAGLNYSEEVDEEVVTRNYEEASVKYFTPFMKEHEYIFENLLVNRMFMDLFPLNHNNNVFDSFVHLIVQFSLIKTILIGISAYNKGLNEDLVIKFIYSFSRAIEHNESFLNEMLSIVKDDELDSMAYMAILIKN